MEFGILGPLDVRQDGKSLPLGGPKQRALLAILLLNANKVVSRERLIDELWGEQPPAEAGNTLNVQISRLRKALSTNPDGEPLLVTQAPGYLLRVAAGELDLQCFEQLLADGGEARASGAIADAAAALREAEALWRGRPLADLEFEPFSRLDVDRLEELRLVALEGRIDAELELGCHSALVAELEGLVVEHPLRERLRAQLMLALYRSGRQADALKAYRSTRAVLVEELGLDPSPRLRELEAAILRHDPELEPSATAVANRAAAPHSTSEPAAAPRPNVSGARRWRWALAAGATFVAFGIGGWGLLHGGASVESPRGHGVAFLSPTTGRLVAALDLSSPPTRMAAGAGSLWVTHADANTVTRVDLRDRTVRDTIPISGGPTAILVAHRQVWVAAPLDGTVSRIDSANDAVTQTIAVGTRPTALVLAAGALWVAAHGDGTVIRLDPETGRVLAVIKTGGGPIGLAASGSTVWVANEAAGTVSRIDARTNTVVQSVRVGDAPSAIAATRDGVWVLDSLDATLSRIDPAQGRVSATIPTQGSASGLAVDQGAVWVTDRAAGTVARVDRHTSKLTAIRALGGRPTAIVPADGSLAVAVRAGGPSHRGGTLRVAATSADIDTLDTAIVTTSFAAFQSTNDGLVTLNHVAGTDGGQLVPDLALTLPVISDDRLGYTFRVRPGLRYSTGEPIKADDVRRSFERLFAIHSEGTTFYTPIIGTGACEQRPASCDLSRGIATDNRSGTVTFHLRRPDPEFVYKLVLPYGFVLPASTARRRARKPLPATGPYLIRRYTPRRQVVLVRNPHFREWSPAAQPAGYPDRIVWQLGLGPRQAAEAVARGDSDVMPQFGFVPPDQRVALHTRHASQLRVNPTLLTQFYFLNTQASPFDDVRVRRALNYALDRGAIVRGYGGPAAANATCQILPPQLPGHRRYCPYTRDQRPDERWRGPDLRRARQLVAQSGTKGMKVNVWTEPSLPRVEDNAVLTALRRLGYRASLALLPESRFFTFTADPDNHAQIIGAGWSADYPAASNFIGKLTCARARTFDNSGFCDPAIDRQIARATSLQATDTTSANALWARLDREITDRAIWLPTVTPVETDLVSTRVANYQYHPTYGALIDQLWVR